MASVAIYCHAISHSVLLNVYFAFSCLVLHGIILFSFLVFSYLVIPHLPCLALSHVTIHCLVLQVIFHIILICIVLHYLDCVSGCHWEEIVLCQCYWSSQLVRPWWRLFCASVTGPVSWSVHGGNCSVSVLLVQSVGPSMVEIVLCQCYWSSQLVRPWRRLFCVSVTGPVSWSVHGGDCSVPVLLVQSVGPSMVEIVLCKCYWSSQLVRPWRRLFCVSVTGPVSWSVHGGYCSV